MTVSLGHFYCPRMAGVGRKSWARSQQKHFSDTVHILHLILKYSSVLSQETCRSLLPDHTHIFSSLQVPVFLFQRYFCLLYAMRFHFNFSLLNIYATQSQMSVFQGGGMLKTNLNNTYKGIFIYKTIYILHNNITSRFSFLEIVFLELIR